MIALEQDASAAVLAPCRAHRRSRHAEIVTGTRSQRKRFSGLAGSEFRPSVGLVGDVSALVLPVDMAPANGGHAAQAIAVIDRVVVDRCSRGHAAALRRSRRQVVRLAPCVAPSSGEPTAHRGRTISSARPSQRGVPDAGALVPSSCSPPWS